MLRLTVRATATAVVLTLGLRSTVTTAQGSGKPSIAIVVLSPTALKGGHAMVQRRVTAAPHDLIVLDGGASEADLAAAVQMLSDMRSRFGDVPQNDLRASVKRFTPGATWRGSRDEADKRELLHDLATAHFRVVTGIGHVRGFPIVIPGR